jgi:hypothetical protein
MLNGSGGPRRCWSLSVLTVVDSKQPATSSTSTLNLVNGPVVRPRKDFGVLAVPSWLRYDPSRQPDLGRWTKIGLSLGCTLGEP